MTRNLGPLAALALILAPSPPTRADGPAVRLPDGFRMTLVADETVADDIQALTLDAKGRVVVTGPGYVKTIHHETGKPPRATVFCRPKSGGMGMFFDGPDLLITADHWLLRYRDGDGDGVADGPPERIIPLATGEHGGHAIRKGPDGWIYVIAGNDAGVDARHVKTADSPVVRPEAGAIVRLSPDLKRWEVVADGFRNPYDFDFDDLGEIHTYDSDCERDESLPWYTPTRAFRVGEGGRHGWRLKGYLRSFARTPGLLDVIPPEADLGRGSPTGVACYRHDAFPSRYRGGLFLADWTFGRLHFLPAGSDSPEVFLEPIGGDGFAPTGLAVAPDGSLLVSIGGRKTRGSVYRIEWTGPARAVVDGSDLDRVLRMPRPLDAPARAVWVPLAGRLGRGAFATAILDASRTRGERIRAVEVVTELFGGVDAETVLAAWPRADALLRTRLAWSLDRAESPPTVPPTLAFDGDDPGLAAALVTLAARGRIKDGARAVDGALMVSSPWVVGPIRRAVRAGMPLGSKGNATPRLNRCLALLLETPTPEVVREARRTALAVLGDPGTRESARATLAALRVLVISLGDWNLDHAEAEAFVAYSTPNRLDPSDLDPAREALRTIIGRGDREPEIEASRVLAMLGDEHPGTSRTIAAGLTESSASTVDLHHLIVLARLGASVPKEDLDRIASALCRLDVKLAGKPGRTKQTWNTRVGEVYERLATDHPTLVDRLLARDEFATPEHAAWAVRTPAPMRARVASRFLDSARADAAFIPSGPLLDLLDDAPRGPLKAWLRESAARRPLADDALIRLAVEPDPIDRPHFLRGLAGGVEPKAMDACLDALGATEGPTSTGDQARAIGTLRLLLDDPKARSTRPKLAAFIARSASVPKAPDEPDDPRKAGAHYAPWLEAVARARPELAGALKGGSDEGGEPWPARAARVKWAEGDARRGEAAFNARRCATCHGGPTALGPDLAGSGRRMSRDDLFAAILQPSRDIAPAYRPILVETADGRSIAGLVVFESAEGLILRTGATTSERVAEGSIEGRRHASTSLMPDGLLKDSEDRELADLYAYLKSL